MSMSAHRRPSAVVVAFVAATILAGCGAPPTRSVTEPLSNGTPGSSQAGVAAPSVEAAPLVKPVPLGEATKPGNRIKVDLAVPPQRDNQFRHRTNPTPTPCPS